VFDEERLQDLFRGWEAAAIHHVGISRSRTNVISTCLMDYAGNPWGTYEQDEPCIRCGRKLNPRVTRSLLQKVACRVAHILNQLQYPFVRPAGNWIHLLLRRSK
jgi:hypothetical protein